MVGLYRAAERRREAALRVLDDPYAKWFLGSFARAALATLEATGRLGRLAEEAGPTGLSTYIVSRHRFIDDALKEALASGAVEQVVVLGAGYDTRAYRLAELLKGRRFYEVDFPATSRRKARIVEAHSEELPSVDVVRVEIDFLEARLEDALAAAGFQRRPTFFIWEGVSMYLTRAAVKSTLGTLRTLGGAGSRLAMDLWFLLDSHDLMSTLRRVSPNLLHFLGEPITFGIHHEDVGPFLERLGFVTDDLADAAALEARYVKDDRRVYPACYVLTATATSDPTTP